VLPVYVDALLVARIAWHGLLQDDADSSRSFCAILVGAGVVHFADRLRSDTGCWQVYWRAFL